MLDYLNVDNQIQTSQILSDEDIVASVRPLQKSSHCPLNRKMMMNQLQLYQAKKPKRSLLQQQDIDRYFDLLAELNCMKILSNVKQIKITDYFQSNKIIPKNIF